ncbi:MAG: iron ABC transporter permease [Acidobacteriota bacterium]|nr:iron ABC transporter permease [Acidobacteriota bacterium]MDH3525068.1 iron ABC transporter permease [Acidobacteriota bacterium]
MSRAPRWAGALLALVLTWLVGYPLLVTLAESLGLPAGLDLSSFAEFVRRPDEWQAGWHSLWISAASVALAALVGIPLGFLFARHEFPGRRLLGSLVILPIALPPLVGVIAFLFLYGESGLLTRVVQLGLGLDEAPWRLNGPGAILLVHAYSLYVFFYLFTRAALARFDASVLEAASALGAGRGYTLRRVTLPLLAPALVGAGLLTFMTALGSFSAPYLFGGGFRVLPTQIVASKLNGELAMARVETVMLAALAFLGLWLVRKLDVDRHAVAGGARGIAPSRRRLQSRGARLAATVAGWGLAVFLLLPHLTLVLISFVPPVSWTTELLPPVLGLVNYESLAATPERLRPVFNSLWMALAATAGALLLGASAARLSLTLRGRLGRWLELLLVVPWAIPGTVFAVALALTFSVRAAWMGRFVLVGTLWILPLAYLVRSLPVTGRSALAGLRQFDARLEEAAASLGAGKVYTWRRITLPLLAPALAAGASLAFITTLGDFVTSIVLYTYDTRPVSVEILSSLRLQDTGVAAVYGVFLMLVSATIFLVWGRQEGV